MSSNPPARRASRSRAEPAPLVVDLSARPGLAPVAPAALRRLLAAAARRLGLGPARLSVLLTGDGEMAAINSRMRGHGKTTDVLAFPAGEPLPGTAGRPHLGDVVVSVETAARQARRKGGVEREVQVLLLHGLLHLVGYDHESDRGEMMRLQAELTRLLVPPPGAPEADAKAVSVRRRVGGR